MLVYTNQKTKPLEEIGLLTKLRHWKAWIKSTDRIK